MSSAITIAGQTRINQLRGLEQPLVIDRMILAMIPGLDPTQAVDRTQQMPNPENIVHTYTIDADHKGYVNPDQVVYSMILGSDVGNFSFNWIGTVEKDTNTIITVTATPETPKRKTDLATNTTGNLITRNVMIAFQDAQNLTGITVSAETWQFDYQADFNTHAALLVDPTATGTDKKHVTDTQAKAWQDHLEDETAHTSFPSGTSMIFNQAIAPTGWTKKSDWAANASLIIGNTYGAGGADSATSWVTAVGVGAHATHKHTITVASHALTVAELASHRHKVYDQYNFTGGGGSSAIHTAYPAGANAYSDYAGSGGGHVHTAINANGGPTTHSVTQDTYKPKYQIVIAAIKG